MTKVYRTTFRLRRGTKSEWLEYNPILQPGEPGFELDTFGLKIGNGIDNYADLPYINDSEGENAGLIINKPTVDDFPRPGDSNVIYKAEKEGRIYQWNVETLDYELLNQIHVDGKSISTENNTIKLAGFEVAETGSIPTKGEDGNLVWSTAEIPVIQNLQQNVQVVETTVTNLQTIIGSASTDSSEATGLIAQIEQKADSSSVYTKEETDTLISNAISNLDHLKRQIIDSIDEIDVTAIGVEKIIFMVPAATAEGNNGYDEYMVVNGKIEKVGSWEVDLSNYVTNEQFTSLKSIVDNKIDESKVEKLYQRIKYEISNRPVTSLVNYREKEIRILCAADTNWQTQSGGGDANLYYVGFRAYAPNEAVSFKEDLAEVISDDTMYYFENNDFAGVDSYGRKYSIVWLPVAMLDPITNTWTYYGANSSEGKGFVGWYYSVEWYNAAGVKISSDSIRINLTNESCHNLVKPWYVLGQNANLTGVSVGGSLMEIINGVANIPIASEELGVVRSSEEVNKIRVLEDGTMEVASLDISRVVSTDPSAEVVMGGGGAAS